MLGRTKRKIDNWENKSTQTAGVQLKCNHASLDFGAVTWRVTFIVCSGTQMLLNNCHTTSYMGCSSSSLIPTKQPKFNLSRLTHMKCSLSWTSWGGSDCPQSSLLHWPRPTEDAHLSHTGPPWPECMWPLMTSCWCQLHPVLLRSEPAGPVPPPDPRYSTAGQEDLQTGWGI